MMKRVPEIRVMKWKCQHNLLHNLNWCFLAQLYYFQEQNCKLVPYVRRINPIITPPLSWLISYAGMASCDSMVKLSLRKEIAQLRQEKDIKRSRMSEVCADLVYHCKRHANEDFLLSCAKGSPHKPAGNDPYKEHSSCSVMWLAEM